MCKAKNTKYRELGSYIAKSIISSILSNDAVLAILFEEQNNGKDKGNL